MLSVKLICVGKLKESHWREAVAEYEKRLKPFCAFQIIELAECRLPDAPSDAQILSALEREGELILKQSAGRVVPLCIEGQGVDSPGLAVMLEEAMRISGGISFVIGSSHGLSEAVKHAGRGISMSRMTFPHQLARVMLCEQLYRGFQILQNSRYHK